MRKEDDILRTPGMKENPFTAPAGYFESLGERTAASALRAEERPAYRLAPYLAYAASLAFLVLAGTFLLKTFTPAEEDPLIEALAYADIYPLTEPDAIYYYTSGEDSASDNDVVEYLIFTGTSLEEISSTNE